MSAPYHRPVDYEEAFDEEDEYVLRQIAVVQQAVLRVLPKRWQERVA